MWITLEAHQDGQQHLTSPHHGLSRLIACGFLLTQTLSRNTGAAPGDECARTVFSLRCGIDCCGYLDDGTLKMGEGKEGSQVGILGSNKNKQDTCMQPRRLTHRRMIEGNTCTVLWVGLHRRYGGTARPISSVRSGRGHPRAFFSSERRLLVVVAASFRTKEWPGRARLGVKKCTSTQAHRSSSADCQSICFVPHPCRKHGPYHSHRSVARPVRAGWRCPVAAALLPNDGRRGCGVWTLCV